MLDRNLQRMILEHLQEHYPRGTHLNGEVPASDEVLAANLNYLEEHGLCESGLQIGIDGHLSFGHATITAKGLDFLADDGGLSAILGTVVVKLHADTIRSLLEAKIEQSDLPDIEKSTLKRRLAALSGAALEVAAKKLVETGLDHLPNAIGWLRSLGL